MAPPAGLKRGPVTRVCHVCGRQYGLSSFDIHLKQCKKLWIAQEELKPPHERRQVPKTPPGLDEIAQMAATGDTKARDAIDAMNRAAQETFNEHGMEKCEYCGRSFAEGRLAIHNRSCGPNNVAKKVGDGAAPRNKKTIGAEYGRVRKLASSVDDEDDEYATPVKKAVAPRPPMDAGDGYSEPAGGSGSHPRALSGSLASNRKKISSQEPTTKSLQTPLAQQSMGEIDPARLQRELQGKNTQVIRMIQTKLEHWEATTLATLQEIRDLKTLFSQMQ